MYLYLAFTAILLQRVCAQNSTQNATTLVDPDLYSGASQACLAALGPASNCNPLVYALYGSFYNSIDLVTLTDLCTDECFSSIQQHRDTINNECAGVQYFDAPSGSFYPVDMLDLQAIAGFNLTCTQDGYVNSTILSQIHLLINIGLSFARHISKTILTSNHATFAS